MTMDYFEWNGEQYVVSTMRDIIKLIDEDKVVREEAQKYKWTYSGSKGCVVSKDWYDDEESALNGAIAEIMSIKD